MSLTTKLVNPTPWPVKYPYERGIYINIPADGEVELSIGQMDDFRSGKPGSEEVRKNMQFEGIFLLDADLSYDVQAHDAVKSCIRSKTQRYKEFVERTKNSRLAAQASIDDSTKEELIVSSGYGKMREQIATLEKREKTLAKAMASDRTAGKIRDTLDPERTCFILQPPRQFASKLALKMFLDENSEIKKEHNVWLKEQNASEQV